VLNYLFLVSDVTTVTIANWSHTGEGIARIGGEVVFVPSVIPGEQVRIERIVRYKKVKMAAAYSLESSSPERVEPVCTVARICGGCQLQHMSASSQQAYKKQVVEEQLAHIAECSHGYGLPIWVQAQPYGYRRRARLSVQWDEKYQQIRMGFRHVNGRRIVSIRHCPVMQEALSQLLEPLKALFASLSIRARIPQVELTLAELTAVVVIRVLSQPSKADEQSLLAFAERWGCLVYAQTGHVGQTELIKGIVDLPLFYRLAQPPMRIDLAPHDFIQVNAEMNQQMIGLLLKEIPAHSDVVDWFCGLGNLSLPMARYHRRVVGVEGCANMVEKARENARSNGIDNASFVQQDLYEASFVVDDSYRTSYSVWVLDPPRSGAAELLQQLQAHDVEKIVYISCQSSTFARDVKILRAKGYQLSRLYIMDMFPQTKHIELMGVFEPK